MFTTVFVGAVLIISSLSTRLFDIEPIISIFLTLLFTIFVVAQDGLFAAIIRRLPNKWFDINRKGFDASLKERKFYDFLQIKLWKDYFPELGGFTDFHKDKVREVNNLQYLERFILECNYGSIIHIFTAFSGFIIVALSFNAVTLFLSISVAIVNLILNFMPAFILRYNVPRLRALHKIAKRKSKTLTK